MRDKTGRRLFLALQASVFLAIVLLPTAEHWSRPIWLRTVASIMIVAGIVVIAVASLGPGSARSAKPNPADNGTLRADGLYGIVRHPLYSGLVLAIAGAVAQSGNLVTLAVGAACVALLTVKANWEEKELVARYHDYAGYAARTPQFVPGWRPRLRPAATK